MSERVRKWNGWALLEPDGKLNRVSLSDPSLTESGSGLLDLGYFSIPVEIIERPTQPPGGAR